jgi:hypothetical protein
MSESRSTLDLVHELETEAANCDEIFLVVGFADSHVKLPNSGLTTKEKLQRLNRLVETGGIPLGLIAYDQHPENGREVVRFYSYVLSDHKGEAREQAAKTLEKIKDAVRITLLQQLPGACEEVDEGPNGWKH